MDAIRSYHPTVLLLYFLIMLGICMFTLNPIFLFLALLGALCAGAMGQTLPAVCKTLGGGAFFCLLIAVVNPLFSQNGATPLFFLMERAVTLESICNGAVIGLMISAALVWFSAFHKVMTEDKLLYLFGRVAPRLTALLSAALRFVPRFRAQHKKIHMAGMGLGLVRDTTLPERMQDSGRELGVLVGWSLEQAVVAGASMQARGYGLKGRSRFSLFRFTGRDAGLLAALLVAAAVMLPGLVCGAATVTFYPRIVFPQLTPPILCSYIGFGFFSLLPGMLAGKEALQWKYYRSKI